MEQAQPGGPLVSCICPTYNRPPSHQVLVEEAIESFLRQDYPHKELVVLNDCPEQELICDAPGVRVINHPVRFETLGEKCNALVDLAKGELVAMWDDDDLSLPWRLSLSVDRLGDADYFNPRAYWYLPRSGLIHDHAVGYAHNASLFRKSAFNAIGGYEPISSGYDRDIDHAFLSGPFTVVDPHYRKADPLTIDEWFYIYRWGVSQRHVSVSADADGAEAYAAIGERPIAEASYYLHPHWREDYEDMVRRKIEGIRRKGE